MDTGPYRKPLTPYILDIPFIFIVSFFCSFQLPYLQNAFLHVSMSMKSSNPQLQL